MEQIKINLNDINELIESEYKFTKEKKYKYIDVNTLDLDVKLKIIEALEKKNLMPNNFLNFVCVTYLDYLKSIYTNSQKTDGNSPENNYSVRVDVLKDYKSKKFGLIIKIDKGNENEQQLVFYCLKNEELSEQFFLQKTLNEPNYYYENLEFSLSQSKSSKNQSSSHSNQNDTNIPINNNNININLNNTNTTNNNININLNNINTTNNSINNNNNINIINNNIAKNVKYIKGDPKKIDDFIKGNVFEIEVNNYLRKKICSVDGNIELPNVFYAIKKIEKDNKEVKSLFYNEFDSVFLVNNDIAFDKNIIKINCKYENHNFENTKEKVSNNAGEKDSDNAGEKDSDNLTIKGKKIVFVECKIKQDFKKDLDNGKLLKKICIFKDLIENIYGISNYGILLLYLYDTKYICVNNDFNMFKNALISSQKMCSNEKMEEVEKYDVFSFYIYHNVYIYNYFNVNNKLIQVKEEQIKDKEHIKKQDEKLKENETELKNLKEQLEALMEVLNINQKQINDLISKKKIIKNKEKFIH